MSSTISNPSTRSPISEVPYDVLREIFLHCLPRYPLDSPQPDTTIAPMLLCQICSSWRMIVLSSPSFWSHLWYCLTMQLSEPDLESWALPQSEIDFVLWWKRNQGSMAPVLRLYFETGDVDESIPLAGDGMSILQKYVTSAQYLQVEPEFWEQIYDKFTFGDQVVFPNVHTLVTDGPRSRYDVDYRFYDAQVRMGLSIPSYPSSTLRRLAIAKDALPEKAIIPKHWSALTHLSMSNMNIPLNFWYSLIRAVPELQWAYFDFEGIDIPDNYTETPTKCTLPQLSTLFIVYTIEYGNYIELPLSMIFTGLHLPALQELSLWSFADSWKDRRAISELYTVLQSTPAITTLTLRGYGFLSLHKASYPTILAGIGDVDSFWSHAPQLTHLQLQLPWIHNCSHAGAGEQLDAFVSNILSLHYDAAAASTDQSLYKERYKRPRRGRTRLTYISCRRRNMPLMMILAGRD